MTRPKTKTQAQELPGYLLAPDVAEMWGVKVSTVWRYLSESRPGGRYEGHPVPPPMHILGRTLAWPDNATTRRALTVWAEDRPGQGHGRGGRRRATTQ